jgi:uncharacterized membrane protein YedE/YeeE
MSFLPSLAGGALIGVAASLLLFMGRETAGISGIVDGMLRRELGGRRWRGAFLAGLLAGGVLMLVLAPQAFGPSPRSLGVVALAGLLVGFGTRMAGGCTSGHGVCGLSRLSYPSLIAVVTFIGAGIATVLALRLAGVGS